MADWRMASRWPERAIAVRLRELDTLSTNFDEDWQSQMTAEKGWQPEHSESLVDREEPGSPEVGGTFERARSALAGFQFSDPTIVEAHFDPEAPLLGRRMLLEIKVLGLRYLCGTVVTDVVDRVRDGRSEYGFRYDTLEGHIERGAEWFVVTKDHATGEVRLCIESRWQRGDFPNWWSRAGFAALGSSYRRVWLHRAHQRMRAFVQRPTRRPLLARPAIRVHRRTDELPPIEPAARPFVVPVLLGAGLGVLAGMRSTAPVALLAARSAAAGPRPGADPLEDRMASPTVSAAGGAMAVGEMIADKLPFMGRRIAAMPLVGRVATGAGSAAMLARRWKVSPWAPAAAGAAAAALSTFATYHLRAVVARRFQLSTAALGAAEDALVVGGGKLLSLAIARFAPPIYEVGHTEIIDV